MTLAPSELEQREAFEQREMERREARDTLIALVEFYPKLREALVPAGGGNGEARVSGSREAPLPLSLEALTVAEDIVGVLVDYEDTLRIHLSQPLVGIETTWTVHLGRVTGVQLWQGSSKVRALAVRRLYAKRGCSTVLTGQWPSPPPRRDGVRHPDQGAQLVAAATYLIPRMESLLGCPVGAEIGAELSALHQRARTVLGLASGDVRLPMPCPEVDCGAFALVRRNGTDVVTCDPHRGGCGMSQPDVDWFVRVHSADKLVPAAVAAKVAGIKRGSITAWVRRGHLEPMGCDARNGRPLYRVGDVLRCADPRSR